MAQVKKLSVKTVWGKVNLRDVLASKEPIHVMRAMGQAIDTKSDDSAYGRWTALLGQFKCINPKTGEVFEGATLFLPDVALIPVRVAMANGPCTFAVDIFVKESMDAKPGGSPYEYSFDHILPPADNDPIKVLEAAIEAQVAEKQKRLAAPADNAPPAPAALITRPGKK